MEDDASDHFTMMADQQSIAAATSGHVPSSQGGEEVQVPVSNISCEKGTQSASSNEGANSNHNSGSNSSLESSDSDGSIISNASNDSNLDRDVVIREILVVLDKYAPEISVETLEWARLFVKENPEMLTAPSTLVNAYPDQKKVYAEFRRGIPIICRVLSDKDLFVTRDWALTLESEWLEVLVEGKEKPNYTDYVDLMYTKAEGIMECGDGVRGGATDVEIIGEIFGFTLIQRNQVTEAKGEGEKAEIEVEDRMDTDW